MTDDDGTAASPTSPSTPPTTTPPTATPPSTPPQPSSDIWTTLDVTPTGLVSALRVGAMAYAVAWVAGLATTLLAIGVAQLEDAGADVSYWWLLTAPGQIVAMAFRSPAVLSASSGGDDYAFTGTFATTAPILTILAIALVAVFRLSRRDESASPTTSTTGAVSLAAATAVSFVAIGWLLAFVLKVSYSEGGDGTSIGAGRIELVLFGLLGVTVTALLGRRAWSTWPSAASIPLAARGAWRGVLTHLVVFSALTIPAAVIWLVIEGDASLLIAVPAAAGNVVVYALTLGHLGALRFAGAGEFLGESEGDSDHLWLFSDGVDAIFWLLLAFAVVATLAASVVLHERGKAAPRTTSHWVWAAVVYGLVGGALTFLGTASTGVGSSFGASGSASFGPAIWFVLVLAAWGALAELLARTVAPALAGALPPAWVERAVGKPAEIAVAPAPTGTAATAQASTGPAVVPPTAPAAPLDPRTRKILVGIAGLAVLAVVAVVGVSVANGFFFGPEKQVKEYFAALEAGDGEKALDLARLDFSDDERALLTADVIGEGGITDVEIGDVETRGDLAEVTVDYQLDGADQSQDVTLRKSGSRFVVFDEWELVDPELGSVSLTAPGATGLTVNGEQVDVSGLDDGVTLPVFPGRYDIEPVGDSDLIVYEPQDASIGTDDEYLDFEAAPSDALVTEVTTQASAYLDECISRREADPDGCPNETYGFDLEDVKWTLSDPPTYAVESDFSGGWRFTTSVQGSATVTAKEPSFIDGEPAEDYKDTVPIDLSGTVSIDGGTVTIKVDDYY